MAQIIHTNFTSQQYFVQRMMLKKRWCHILSTFQPNFDDVAALTNNHYKEASCFINFNFSTNLLVSIEPNT